MRTIRQNLFFAFIYNIIGIPIAAVLHRQCSLRAAIGYEIGGVGRPTSGAERKRYLFAVRLSFAALPCVAQTQVQARSYADSPTFNTMNPDLAVDESLATSATLKPALIGGAVLRVNFPGNIQPGQQAMLYVKAASGSVDATVLGRMTIRTYLSTS
nr:hypothetical protein [Tanacetum cinerariifolium]